MNTTSSTTPIEYRAAFIGTEQVGEAWPTNDMTEGDIQEMAEGVLMSLGRRSECMDLEVRYVES